MKLISLFAGIDGFGYAAEEIGWEVAAYCEINQFCQYILKDKYTNAESHKDIKNTDFSVYRGRVDILTGGFPCQPYSLAGQRKGTEDERHLWPEMLRAIRESQPTWVVGENVPGIINWNGGLVFEQVQVDLEAEGYEVLPFILPAAGVGAPHKRDRVWFIAYSYKCANCRKSRKNASACREKRLQKWNKIRKSRKSNSFWRFIAYSESFGRRKRNREEVKYRAWETGKPIAKRREIRNRNKTIGGAGISSYSRFFRRNGGFSYRKRRYFQRNINRYAKKNKSKWGVRKCWISKIGQVASDARIIELQRSKFDGSVKGKRSIKTSSGQFSRSICSAWEIFPTQPPVCDGDDGFSTELLRQRIREDCMGNLSEKEIDKIISKALTEWRQETIKAGGNAVVPQVVLQIFKAIEKYQLLYV